MVSQSRRTQAFLDAPADSLEGSSAQTPAPENDPKPKTGADHPTDRGLEPTVGTPSAAPDR